MLYIDHTNEKIEHTNEQEAANQMIMKHLYSAYTAALCALQNITATAERCLLSLFFVFPAPRSYFYYIVLIFVFRISNVPD